MSPSFNYLAFDLGAESGRALLGRYHEDFLTLEEIHRFANEPVQYNGELHWDVARLWREMLNGLSIVSSRSIDLDSIGVDAWGVDFSLLGEHGTLVENPYHYRDPHTDGMMERAFVLVPPSDIYAETGIQFTQVNGLYRLFSEQVRTPKILQAAEKLVTIPDLFNFWLTGIAACEFTNATTMQFYSLRQHDWARDLLARLGIPTHFLTDIVQPGTVLGGLRHEVAKNAGMRAIPVVAPACHDTASAVAAIARASQSVFISSGTWSLLGTEVREPVINKDAQQLNFTNEGGVCGTLSLLKNITGLWLLQRCRQDWQLSGYNYTYGDLTQMAAQSQPFCSLLDPDHRLFLHPENMQESIAEFCSQTSQPAPQEAATTARAILESLALKYRWVLDRLESLAGKRFEEIHIVGGGAQNDLLNQFTAEATGRRVVAGPVEATALGNIGMQMLAARTIESLDGIRDLIARSFPAKHYLPREQENWEHAYSHFQRLCEAS